MTPNPECPGGGKVASAPSSTGQRLHSWALDEKGVGKWASRLQVSRSKQ